MPRAEFICLANGVFQENCYIVADRDTGEAALVDPGEEAELFLARVTHERLVLKAVWLTHAHIDHIMGVRRVVEETKVPIYLHPADRRLYEGAAQQGAWLGVRAESPPPPDHDLAHGDTLKVGGLTFVVRHVPGHSPGGVAIIGHGAALVGDALFASSIGRVDLPGGDAEALLDSIRTQLLTLPDETVVYPGHGPATTIGVERRSNPFLTGAYRLV